MGKTVFQTCDAIARHAAQDIISETCTDAQLNYYLRTHAGSDERTVARYRAEMRNLGFITETLTTPKVWRIITDNDERFKQSKRRK